LILMLNGDEVDLSSTLFCNIIWSCCLVWFNHRAERLEEQIHTGKFLEAFAQITQEIWLLFDAINSQILRF
jgi:hypothetical protein